MAFFGSKGFMGMDGGFGDDGDTGGEIDNKELYESLELNTDATIDDIKKKFRDLAKKHHPDRGGDGEKFKEINAAYEVLSNPEKKKIYDKYGLEGLKNGGID
jgi:DnaJ family protein A protein 2